MHRDVQNSPARTELARIGMDMANMDICGDVNVSVVARAAMGLG